MELSWALLFKAAAWREAHDVPAVFQKGYDSKAKLELKQRSMMMMMIMVVVVVVVTMIVVVLIIMCP